MVCNPEAMAELPQKLRESAQFFSVNGISAEDLSRFRPSQPKGGPFRILSAGKLIPLKGFELAIKAFAEFARSHPEATFTIVGDGPGYQHLMEVVRQSQVEGKVNFEGWRPRVFGIQTRLRRVTSSPWAMPVVRLVACWL